MKPRVLFLRSNPIAPDPRVEKEAQALAEEGYRVRVLGWDRTTALPPAEETPFYRIERLRIPGRVGAGLRNLPHLLRFQLGLLAYLWRRRGEYDIVHACDFDTVLPALCAKILWRKRVVYDIFDFYAEMLRKTPSFLKRAIRWVDLRAMGLADGIVLADESRIEQIAGARPQRMAIVRNAPHAVPALLPEEVPGPPPLRIAYVGLLQVERGLMEMLDLLEAHPEWELDLGGYGGEEREIAERAGRMPNVRFHGRVPYERALELMGKAHVLFATYDPFIPNHRYSSANKLFEAMALGKPIIVAEGTGMDRLVREHGLGFVVRYGNVEDLREAVAQVASWSEEERRAFAQRVRSVYEERFAWGKSKESLLSLYASLAPSPNEGQVISGPPS